MKPLSRDDVIRAMTAKSPSLVKEVYDTILRQSEANNARQTVLDGKASSLLSTIGISVTLISAVVLQFLFNSNHVDRFKTMLGFGHRVAFVVALVMAVICALVAGVVAILALSVSRIEYLESDVIINQEAIHGADTQEDAIAVTEYRRYIIPSLWAAFSNNFNVYQKKGRMVLCGQWLFFWSLLCLAAVACIMGGQLGGMLI